MGQFEAVYELRKSMFVIQGLHPAGGYCIRRSDVAREKQEITDTQGMNFLNTHFSSQHLLKTSGLLVVPLFRSVETTGIGHS